MHFDLSEVTQVTALDSLQFFACLACPIISSSLSSLPYLIPLARAKQAKVACWSWRACTKTIQNTEAPCRACFITERIFEVWNSGSAYVASSVDFSFSFQECASPCSSTYVRCQGLKDSRDPSALTLYSSTVAFHSWFDQSLCSICRHPLSSPNNIENASCALYQSWGPKIFNIFHFQTLASTSIPCATKSFLHPLLGLRYSIAKCWSNLSGPQVLHQF